MSTRGDTDSASEFGGRGSSLASMDDINEVAALLGIADPQLVTSDRFKIDRKRLERLLFENENPNAAYEFFDNVMAETNTKVIWPSRLKLGAKSRKDPHVKVMGLLEGVEVARKMIGDVLDMRSSRVTMKIDVSYTDHSHIIGKGGLSIKRVMEETKCHIHFPDSNRCNTTEKSNQVSITGALGGVELARFRIRELTPLIFCFDLLNMGLAGSIPIELSDPFIVSLQEKYNVQVMLRSRQKLNSTLITVKGFEWEVMKVKEATQVLISHTYGSPASQVQVHMMLEISPNHQSIVLGQNNENIREIMKRTSTQIIFVDPNDPNIPKIKKSNVTITGNIDNVYLARQQLIGSLPVVLIFDVPDTFSSGIGDEKMESIMNNLDVFITTKSKFNQNCKSFIIKGIERNAGNIYEARRRLLDLNEEPVLADIPITYQIPNAQATFRKNYCDLPYSVSSPLAPGGPNMFQFQWPTNTCQRLPVIQPPVFVHCPPPVTAIPWNTLAPDIGHLSHSSISLPDMPECSSGLNSSHNISSSSAGSRAASPILQVLPDKVKQKLVGSDSQLHNVNQEWRAPGSGRKPNATDYQQIKMQAMQAFQQNVIPGEVRVPTSAWSGHGFSHSSPYSELREMRIKQEENAILLPDRDGNGNRTDDFWQDDQGPLANSNYLENLPSNTRPVVTSGGVRSLLASVGLEKYTPLFISNEVDVETFRTLTDDDLKAIGVSAFGARRKIAVCIAELNRQSDPVFNISASNGNKTAPPPGFHNW